MQSLDGLWGDGKSEEKFIDKNLMPKLNAIRGLCGKAKRVITNAGLFASLARKEQIRIHVKQITYGDLIKMLIEAAKDNELLVEPSRNIKFYVDRGSFDMIWAGKFEADQKLLEQAISDIFDNAGKYSFSGTTVQIYGGRTRAGRFCISVTNIGLSIRNTDIRSCMERGWRGDEAQWTTGEGSGIGLWIADNIIKAHGGELVIVPTTESECRTEVKLIFPDL